MKWSSTTSYQKAYPSASGKAIIRISGNFWTRVSPISGRGSRQQLWSGRSRSPAGRAERADQGVIGGEPVPRRLAGIHDVHQAGKYRVGEPMAAQIVPNPLDWIELRAVEPAPAQAGGGSANKVILLGSTSPWPLCQLARSRITTAWASAATWLLISQR